MDSDVETLDIERLEENLGCLLSVLWWIERGFGLGNDLRELRKKGNNAQPLTRRK